MGLDLGVPEGLEVEYKKAADAVPRSFWETYSSFANTCGGIVVFGVSEDGGLHVTGVNNASKIVDDLWNMLADSQKVSANILADEDVRELIMNALLHADYQGEMGVVIDRRPDSITISNPGLFRIPVGAAVKGGQSNPRNPTLFRMFRLIGLIERAGTGVNRSMEGVKSSGSDEPVIEQTYEPSRTTVIIGLRKAVNACGGREEAILNLIRADSGISLDRLSSETGLSRNRVYTITKTLTAEGRLRREGSKRGGRWVIPDRTDRFP